MSNFDFNSTFINFDVTKPDTNYQDAWSLFFAIPILPFSLTLVWTLAGLYLVGMVLFSRLTKGPKVISGTERFAASPWWALAWSRIIMALIGVIFFLGCRFARIPAFPLGPFSIPCFTFFLDLGSYFIVIGQIRALFIIVNIHHSFRYALLRRLWGFVVFVMLLASLYLGPFKFKPGVIQDAAADDSNVKALPDWLYTLADVGYAVSGVSRSVLGITAVGILPFMVRTVLFKSRRKSAPPERFDHGRWVTACAGLVSFVLLVPIILLSSLRVWIGLQVPLAVYVVCSTLPELIIFGLWVALGCFVTRQDTLLAKKQEEVRTCLRLIWLGYLTSGQLDGLPAVLREFVSKYNIVINTGENGQVKGMHGVASMMWYYASALPSQRQFGGMMRPPRLLKELEGLFEGLRVPGLPEEERVKLLREDHEKSRTVGWLKDAVDNFGEGMRQKFFGDELGTELPAADEGYYEKGVDPETGFTAGQALRMYVESKRIVDVTSEMAGFEQYDLGKVGEVQVFVQNLFEILANSVVLVERRQDSIFRESVPWQIDTAATRVEFVRNLLDAPFKPESVKDAGDLADIWLEVLLWERGGI